MADVFVSYARADRARAEQVVHGLQAHGLSVWWDHDIQLGANYHDAIPTELRNAKSVVVLWTHASTASTFVRNEATVAESRDQLVPALLDADVEIPIAFLHAQAADLSSWNGDANAPAFLRLVETIRRRAATPGPAPVPPRPAPPAPTPGPPPPRPIPQSAPGASAQAIWWIVGAALLVIAVLAGMWAMQLEDDDGPAPLSGPTPAPGPVIAAGATTTLQPLDQTLSWRDDALVYAGRLVWNGQSPAALASFTVADGATRTPLGPLQLQAAASRVTPVRVAFSMVVAVPGDSRTQGPHTHQVNLVFEHDAQGGNWRFVQNCMTPTVCF